jgi:glycopeptide antibiotics resistance protein
MDTITKSLRDVLTDTWPMIVLTCVVLISIRLTYLLKNKQKLVIGNEIMMLTFIVYILCLFQIVTSQDVSGVHGVNLTIFKELTRYQFGSRLFIRNIVGNILMFIPFGFFTSYYLKLDKKRYIFYLALIVSIVIELIQLKIGRAFDVDDIILNMVGSLLGYFVYRLMDKIFGDLSDNIKGAFIVIGILTSIVILAILLI